MTLYQCDDDHRNNNHPNEFLLFLIFFVFLKGTTSNGRGLLKLVPFQLENKMIRGRRVQIVTLAYNDTQTNTPIYSAGNMLGHSIRLCTCLHHRLHVIYLDHRESILNQPSERENSSEQLRETLSELLAQTGRLRRVQLGIYEKEEFLRYFNNRRFPKLD